MCLSVYLSICLSIYLLYAYSFLACMGRCLSPALLGIPWNVHPNLKKVHQCGSQVLLLLWSGIDVSPRYHMTEYFSGHAQVSAAFRENGMSVASYDVEYCGKPMNFLECGGFAILSGSLNVPHVQQVRKRF